MKTISEREGREESRAVAFLLEASRLYQDTCPELARFLMQRPQEANELSVTSHCRKCQLPKRRCGQHHNGEYSVCRYCRQWLEPGNHHRVRLRPKRRASARVQSALRREARGRRLGLAQKEMLRRFRTSRSTLMATCHTCNTTSRYSGASRDFTSPFSRNQQSTPGGGGGISAARRQKTPQAAGRVTSTSSTSTSSSSNTPKSLRKDNKTPTRTPCRASSSSSSSTPASASSSSSSKVKKWVVQRLSKILVREDEPGRKKSSLKDFLCSL